MSLRSLCMSNWCCHQPAEAAVGVNPLPAIMAVAARAMRDVRVNIGTSFGHGLGHTLYWSETPCRRFAKPKLNDRNKGGPKRIAVPFRKLCCETYRYSIG